MQDSSFSSRAHCPIDQLGWYINRTLSIQEDQAIEAHLSSCEACCKDIVAISNLRIAMNTMYVTTSLPRVDLFTQVEKRLDTPYQLMFLRFYQDVCASLIKYVVVMFELCATQFRLLKRDLFWMPLLIILMTLAISCLPHSLLFSPSLLAFFAALIAAISMAFLYGSEVDPVREMAMATVTSPSQILAMRCGVVFVYNLIINCGIVLPILLLHHSVTSNWFLSNWLAPLCFLSALTLLISIVINASTAIYTCAILWALRALGAFRSAPLSAVQQQYMDFWHQGPWLFTMAFLSLVLTFIVLERKEHFQLWLK